MNLHNNASFASKEEVKLPQCVHFLDQLNIRIKYVILISFTKALTELGEILYSPFYNDFLLALKLNNKIPKSYAMFITSFVIIVTFQ